MLAEQGTSGVIDRGEAATKICVERLIIGALLAAAARRRLTIAPVRPLPRALSFLALGGAGLEFGDMLFALDQRFEPIVRGHLRFVLGFRLTLSRLSGLGGGRNSRGTGEGSPGHCDSRVGPTPK